MYRGPRRTIDPSSLERDKAGRILAVTLKECRHRLVYERRQTKLRSPETCCRACVEAPGPEPVHAPPPRGGAPRTGSPAPAAALGPSRRRPAGSPLRMVGVPVGPGVDEVAERRRDRDRLEALRGRQLSQGEQDALLAGERLFRTKCGSVDHAVALEQFERALRIAGRLGGS